MDRLFREILDQSRMASQAARNGMWHQWTLHASQSIGMLRALGALVSEGTISLSQRDNNQITMVAGMLEEQLQEAKSERLPQGFTNVAHALWKQYLDVLKIGLS